MYVVNIYISREIECIGIYTCRQAKAKELEVNTTLLCWGRSKRERRRIHATNTGEFFRYYHIYGGSACIDSRDCLCNLKFSVSLSTLYIYLITFLLFHIKN